MEWRKVFEDQSKATPLSLIIANEQFFALPLGEHMEPFEVWLPKDKVWERYNTISQIALLEGEDREVSCGSILHWTQFRPGRYLTVLAGELVGGTTR